MNCDFLLPLNRPGWRGNFLLSAAEQWLKHELTKKFKVIRDLELLPQLLGQDWSSVFLQRFEGVITFVKTLLCQTNADCYPEYGRVRVYGCVVDIFPHTLFLTTTGLVPYFE